MKTTSRKVLLAGLLPALLTGLAVAGLEGSKHDFSSDEWSDDDKCGACHVPHRSADEAEKPLWDDQADLNRTFGWSLEETERAGDGTLLCLRCHDGTIARETIPVSGERRKAIDNLRTPARGRGHGSSDHPVGVPYPSADRYYHSPALVERSGEVRLPAGNIECISCHDPHNESGQPHMLVKSNYRSALCLTCHVK